MIKECHATYLDVKLGKEIFLSFAFNCLEPIGFPDLLVLDLYSCKIANL